MVSMMSSVIAHPRPRVPVVYGRMPDGSAVLVDGETRDAYALNATGADVWELCDGVHSVAAIAAALLDRYDATPDEAAAGVAALLADFRRLGVLEEA